MNVELEQFEGLTLKLKQWQSNKNRNNSSLFSELYKCLTNLAEDQYPKQSDSLLLSPEVLLNEAFIKLNFSKTEFTNRYDFYELVARLMRFVLLEQARNSHRMIFVETQAITEYISQVDANSRYDQLLELDIALDNFKRHHPKQSLVLNFYYFTKLNQTDIADKLSISIRTVERHLQYARIWMQRYFEVNNNADTDITETSLSNNDKSL